jgi:2'-5' RNA ligase
MRLFFAIEPPDPLRDALAALVLPPDVRRVPRDQLHLTLKFIADGDLDAVAAIGRTALTGPRFSLELRGGGAFPSPSRARVLWAGLDDPSGRAVALAGALDQGLAAIGVPREDRPFAPHLTLGRAKRPLPRGSIAGLLALGSLGAWEVEEVVLFESRLGRDGAVHVHRGRFPLG